MRQVRNILEQQGYRPLMFFLNCLNDDNEIDGLIKREIDSREKLLGEYYKDPGVDKYEGFVWPNNKIIDIDYSEKNKEDLPSLIYNFLREIDNSINNIFSYAEGCRKNVIEIKALEKCIDLECAYIEPDKLEALGFSFENNNEYIIYDAQSIIRSTAMFELACNYFLKKSYNKAIELFYSASILGMKNAQKVLCELGPSLLPSGIIDKLKKSAFKSADGFSEYLLAKSVESKQAFLDDKDAVLHLYEYSTKKGCMFGCEEINGLYAMQQDTNINQKLDKRYDTCWYEHCLMEYPNRICWEKLQEYIIKKSKCK